MTTVVSQARRYGIRDTNRRLVAEAGWRVGLGRGRAPRGRAGPGRPSLPPFRQAGGRTTDDLKGLDERSRERGQRELR